LHDEEVLAVRDTRQAPALSVSPRERMDGDELEQPFRPTFSGGAGVPAVQPPEPPEEQLVVAKAPNAPTPIQKRLAALAAGVVQKPAT